MIYPVTQGYLNYNSINPTPDHRHAGIDFGAPVGRAVLAAKGGQVINGGGPYGTVAVYDGTNTVIYLHLKNIRVQIGQSIPAGRYIGDVGNVSPRPINPHSHGERMLIPEVRYFFTITNDRAKTAAEVVFFANDRCDQENLLAQLSGGVRALAAPVDNLLSNWAHMVMTSLAWTLKAWSGLLLPVTGRWSEQHETARRSLWRMEFKTFVNALIRIPCQIVRQARRTILRVLNWNPQMPIFFRLCKELRC